MSSPHLATRTCNDCASGTPTLDEARAADLSRQLDVRWKREANRVIRRTFEFTTFREPFALATQVALLAESQGHHPDLEVSWGKLVVTLTTHSAGGLTENDFIMAAKIDRFASK